MILLGERIKYLRQNARYTQDELAARLNVSKASVSAYERNLRQPSLDVIISLARIFNVSTDYVLMGKTNMIIEVSGLTDEQRKSVYEIANLYKTCNRYEVYMEKHNLLKHLIEESEQG